MQRQPLANSSHSGRVPNPLQHRSDAHDSGDKENNLDRKVMPKNGGSNNMGDTRGNSQSAVIEDQTNGPQTPSGRIPFSDLIANPEDALNRPITATPVDQVEWKNGPGSSEPSCSAKSVQRRRKRARSSSPVSLSQAERSKHFATNKDPLDLESISRSLRTPKHDDPLSLLWANYAGVRGAEGSDELVLPPLPPMSSSPNTPAALKKDSLRRTASCGIEWPVSTSKKRKFSDRDSYNRAKGIFAAQKDAILAKSATNQSKVSILVDSIHQSLLKKSVIEANAPSSSSPLPDRHGDLQLSPSKDIASLAPIVEEQEELGIRQSPLATVSEGIAASEYGESDLDPDDPDLLDAVQAATQNPVHSTQSVHLTNTHSACGRQESFVVPHANTYAEDTRPRPTPSAASVHGFGLDPGSRHQKIDFNHDKTQERQKSKSYDDFDNFDDDDDLATELADLAKKVDSQDVANVDGVCEMKLAPDPAGSELQIIDEFDDVFGNDDDMNDIWTAVNDAKSQPDQEGSGSMNQKVHDSRAIKRYLIQEVFESQYKNRQGRHQPEKVLSIKSEKFQQLYIIHLRQSWYDTRCTKGSFVHLIGEFDRHGNCIVDDTNNMVILHPDHLISATTVADSFSCTRRATLQDRVKATSPATPPQVYGHLIHEVFGEALRQNQWDAYSLRRVVEKLIPNYIESLFEINVQTQDAIEYVMGKMPELTAWASIFVTAKLDTEATIRDRNGAVVPMAIDKLLELEEHVWSPMYGLKGNIDATVQAQMILPGDVESRTLTVPFELKTGKRDSNEMHRAQTALYTLLLSDRYDINVTSGILYYLETSKTFRVEGIRNEIRHMVIQRNELACYVHEKLDLPPMVKREHLCKKCFAQTACFTYHKLAEAGDGETSGMKSIFTDAVGHLKAPHQTFFKKWDDLLTKEERDAMKFKRELWTMLSHEREAVGRCFSNVMIEPGSAVENSEAPKVNRYSYSFVKHNPRPGFSFMESQVTLGEPIVVSDEQGHFALAIGFVTNVRPTRVTVTVDRRLQNARTKQPGYNPMNNQVFSAIMAVDQEDQMHMQDSTNPDVPKLYRIDKDEFATGMATARNNVLRIMEKDLWRARELRQLIIDKSPPTFKQVSSSYTLSGPASQQNLNVDQRKAIEKVMSARDYALVLGMPGTGKTTTIAHIIRALVSQGKSVLLTSYTHTAVDNILLKIRDDNIPILRLGALGKVHPDVAGFADLGGIPKRTIPELEASWTKSKVVATTCLGINHAIFNHRKFDYCIVDEASQITLPVCLGPVRLASTFILVGDHYQLPPLVQNKEAQEGGLDISLFKMLSDAQPSSVVNLEHQYRMAEDIMLLSNRLIYDGRLKCGTSAVASRVLRIPNLAAGLEAHHYSPSMSAYQFQPSHYCVQKSSHCWIADSLEPLNRTVFLNTDTASSTSNLGAPEMVAGHGTRITNHTEASLVAQLLTTLIRSGVPPNSIGVITFYRSQLAVLRSTVKAVAGTLAAGEIEMHTADKYQGRDKEVILLSCVRSNDNQHVGELLKDWRRVNVAITRARSKLIIVGSLSTLGGSGVPVLEGLSQVLKEKNWVLNLPHGVLDLHHFEGMATQTQPQSRSNQASRLRSDRVQQLEHNKPSSNDARADHRMPLASVTNNVRPGIKQPAKVVKGGINIDRFFDRHPVISGVMDGL